MSDAQLELLFDAPAPPDTAATGESRENGVMPAGRDDRRSSPIVRRCGRKERHLPSELPAAAAARPPGVGARDPGTVLPAVRGSPALASRRLDLLRLPGHPQY